MGSVRFSVTWPKLDRLIKHGFPSFFFQMVWTKPKHTGFLEKYYTQFLFS